MTITLSTILQRRIEERMRADGYSTPEDVVSAGVASLEQSFLFGEFAPGELDALLAEGEASGEPIDADAVFAELRALGVKDVRKPI